MFLPPDSARAPARAMQALHWPGPLCGASGSRHWQSAADTGVRNPKGAGAALLQAQLSRDNRKGFWTF